MTVSALRTIVLRSSHSRVPRIPRWPTAQPADSLDYSADLSVLLTDVTDTLVSASLAIEPSGTGELQITSLTALGSVVTAWLTGGVAGRDYRCALIVNTAGGRAIEEVVHLTIDHALASRPLPCPPSKGFGTPVVWVAPPTLVFVPATNAAAVTFI